MVERLPFIELAMQPAYRYAAMDFSFVKIYDREDIGLPLDRI
jgi:hypothetical protein